MTCSGKQLSPIVLLLLVLACFFSACQQSTSDTESTTEASDPPPPAETVKPLRFVRVDFQKKGGPCKDGENQCAKASLNYPRAMDGKAEVSTTINQHIQKFIVNIIGTAADDSEKTIESAVKYYVSLYNEYIKETPENDQSWEIEVTSDTKYLNQYAVVYLTAYTYLGGAHPNVYTNIANFNSENGQELKYADFVQDTMALRQIVEKEFMAEMHAKAGTDLTIDDFFFGEGFQLPDNFALEQDSIYFLYNNYEAAAYVFGQTDFKIAYSTLKDIIRL